MPDARFTEKPENIERLSACVDRFDAFFLDAFGVLNIGDTVIPGAPELVASLQRSGKPVLVLTNGATYPAPVVLARYRAFGFDFEPENIVSSRDVLIARLAYRKPARWGVMAKSTSAIEQLPAEVALLETDARTYAGVDGFILLGSGEWTDAQQALLVRSLRENPRPVLVGNPDIVAPRGDHLSRAPGYFAHDLVRRTGIAPEFFGKPFANIFDTARQRLPASIPGEKILMVGDTLHTDILGGAAAGIRTAFLTGYGLFAGTDYQNHIDKCAIRPDLICNWI
ncbi:MAG: HAD-IIA family hydrolase [Alphaproteobacteria bacterium]